MGEGDGLGDLEARGDLAGSCGEGAGPHPATDAALALRAILCETVDARLFNVVLTPNYNRPHKNHFHLDGAAYSVDGT